MNRILDIPETARTPEQSAIIEQLIARRGKLLTPYKVWIHSPRLAGGMEDIGTFLNKQCSLSRREVEIGILVIACHWDADYVRQAHIREGRDAGLPEAAIQDIIAGRDPKLPDPHEQAVYTFAAALAAGKKLSDAEFGAIEKVLGRDGVAEVLVLLGYYTSVALAMKVHDLPVVKA
ncbi:MAG: carboxymuconolactone decarboxylase family protein [Xanthobacteraceae bacterium]